MRFEKRVELTRFLKEYPGMRVQPSGSRRMRLRGDFAFKADCEGGPTIEDTFRLAIDIPRPFPKMVPVVEERGGRIPRNPDHHVNPGGTLCLGSPARLLLMAAKAPTICGFADSCIVPFLYATSYQLQHGGALPFGELPHGPAGEIEDYMELLGLSSVEQVLEALKLLGMKKRKANKKPCPCGCGRRLGACRFNKTIYRLRDQVGRPQFRSVRSRLIERFLRSTQ